MATATAISTGMLSVEGIIEGVSSTVDQGQVLATASPHNCNLQFKLASSSDRWPRSGALGDFGRRPLAGGTGPYSGLGLRPEMFWSRRGLSCSRKSYGARPSLSYWRVHSAGKSRTVATPMPRGSRPSTAAWTSLGAIKASVIVRLTCLMLYFSRAAICSTFMTVPAIKSSSQRRPFAIAVTSWRGFRRGLDGGRDERMSTRGG
jgi:hypothetical protein